MTTQHALCSKQKRNKQTSKWIEWISKTTHPPTQPPAATTNHLRLYFPCISRTSAMIAIVITERNKGNATAAAQRDKQKPGKVKRNQFVRWLSFVLGLCDLHVSLRS
jgi:hypothetical protein